MKKEKALAAAERFLHGFYEDGTPMETLLANADPMHFSWIGAEGKEFFDSREALLRYEKQQARRAERKRVSVEMREMQCLAVEPDILCVTARFFVSTASAKEERRATLIYIDKKDTCLLAHVHLSGPRAAGGKEEFPVNEGRANYEYMRMLEELHQHRQVPKLTDRQRRILTFLRQGFTYREIGEMLNISHRTVRGHVTGLIHCFRVENRAQLIATASEDWLEEEGKETPWTN